MWSATRPRREWVPAKVAPDTMLAQLALLNSPMQTRGERPLCPFWVESGSWANLWERKVEPTCSARVPRYYFDTYDDEAVITDDVGLECEDLVAVKEQAALSLAELAHDVIPGSVRRRLAVKVRYGDEPVLEARLTFEAIVLKD